MSNMIDKFNEFSIETPLLKERLKGILNNEYYSFYGGCVEEVFLLSQVDNIGYAIFCDWEKDNTKNYNAYNIIIQYVREEMEDKFMVYTKDYIELENIMYNFIVSNLVSDNTLKRIEWEFGKLIYKSKNKFDNVLKYHNCNTLVDYLRFMFERDSINCELIEKTNWLNTRATYLYTEEYMKREYSGFKGKLKRLFRWVFTDNLNPF